VTARCKARQYYESPSRQLKNEGEKFFHTLKTSIHCLWQWPYHSKIPRAGTEAKLLSTALCFLTHFQGCANQVDICALDWVAKKQIRTRVWINSPSYEATRNPTTVWKAKGSNITEHYWTSLDNTGHYWTPLYTIVHHCTPLDTIGHYWRPHHFQAHPQWSLLRASPGVFSGEMPTANSHLFLSPVCSGCIEIEQFHMMCHQLQNFMSPLHMQASYTMTHAL